MLVKSTLSESELLFPSPPGSLDFAPRLFALASPKLRHNPKFWLKIFLEGPLLYRQLFSLIEKTDRVLDAGCGSGFLSHELALRSEKVVGIDNDPRFCRWASSAVPGQENLKFLCLNLDEPEAVEELSELGTFDKIYAGFLLSRCENPEVVIKNLVAHLKPGGLLIIHDCDRVPDSNIARLARWRAKMSLWKQSDPWTERRSLERSYRQDAARVKLTDDDFSLDETLRAAEGHLKLLDSVETRPILDLYLASGSRLNFRRALAAFLLTKAADTLLLVSGLLRGTCSFRIYSKEDLRFE